MVVLVKRTLLGIGRVLKTVELEQQQHEPNEYEHRICGIAELQKCTASSPSGQHQEHDGERSDLTHLDPNIERKNSKD